MNEKEFADNYVLIGTRIRTVQSILGFADKEMADIFSVSVGQYRDLVKGRYRLTEDKFLILSNVLKVDMNFIHHGDETNGIFLDESAFKKVDARNYGIFHDSSIKDVLKMSKKQKAIAAGEVLNFLMIVIDSIATDKDI